LAERSNVVDEIDADQNEIEVLAEMNQSEGEEPLEVFIETVPEDVNRDGKSFAGIPSTNYVKNIELSFTEQLNAIESQDLTEKQRMEKSASLNAETALEIDSIVGVLVVELDNPNASISRDSLQMQIQLLDAIAADKRQEVDRLSNEVEMLNIVDNETSLADATVSEVGRDENVNLPENTVLVENIEISELESEWIEEPETTGLKYKSLNANIARERMEPMIDSLNL